MNNETCMSLDEFIEVHDKVMKYEYILNACFEGVELDWKGEDLCIDGTCIREVLKVLEPDDYVNVLETLKQKAKEGAADGNV